jgi:hypothetical protein
MRSFSAWAMPCALADRNSDAWCGRKQRGETWTRTVSAHLVARVHVHAPPITVVEATIFNMVCGGSRNGHSAHVSTSSSSSSSADRELRAGDMAGAEGKASVRDGKGSHGAGARCTHPFEAIVTIGAALLLIRRRRTRTGCLINRRYSFGRGIGGGDSRGHGAASCRRIVCRRPSG